MRSSPLRGSMTNPARPPSLPDSSRPLSPLRCHLITVEPGAGIVADERRAPVRSQHSAAVSLAGCAGDSFVVQLTSPPSAPPSLTRLQVAARTVSRPGPWLSPAGGSEAPPSSTVWPSSGNRMERPLGCVSLDRQVGLDRGSVASSRAQPADCCGGAGL